MIEIETLPDGWTVAQFEDLLDYIQPTKFIVASTEYDDSYKTPVLTAGKSFIIGYTNETDGIFNSLPTIIFDDFTTATKFVNFPFKVKSSAMKILQPTHEMVNIKYAYYYMQTVHIKSETHKRYWISEYSKIELFFPPYNEQKKIVEKLEELFSDLDKGIEYLNNTLKQLKVYRQAVLKFTFEGGDINRTEYILKDVSAKIQIGPFGTQLHKEDYVEGGIPLINPMHIENGKIVADNSYSITTTKRDSLPNYIMQVGDIIMGRRGEMGRCGLVTEKEKGWFCGTGSLFIRPKKELIDSKFLYYFLTGDTTKKYLEENAGGTTMANLNLKIVNNIPAAIPSIKEQRQIVLEVESRLSVCDKIEEMIEESLKQSEILRYSILKKAFSGKLVPQDPNDEPASILLQRIKAEKGKNIPVKKEREQKPKSLTKMKEEA